MTIALALTLFAAAAPAPQATPDAVLVMALRPLGIAAADAGTLGTQLAFAVAQHTALRVISGADIDQLLAHQALKSKLGCEDESCIAELSRLAQARFALSGTVGQVGDKVVLSLALLDTRNAASVGSSTRSLDSIDDAFAALPAMLAEVFASEAAAARPRYQLPQGQRVSFAVFDLEPLGIGEVLAQNLTQVLAVEVKSIEGTQVVSRDDIASMLQLQAERNLLDCADDAACLAEIGGALGVDKLIVGHLGKVGESYVISLRLLDGRSVKVDSRVNESFKGLEDQLIRAVKVAARNLLGVAVRPDPGILALAASQGEATVFLDDREVGLLPMPPLAALPPGKHSVRISKSAFLDWRSDVYVEPGTTTPLWAQLEEAPERWYEKWWVWAIAGGVVAAGAGVAIYLAVPQPQSSSVNVGAP